MEPSRYGPFRFSMVSSRPPLRWPNGKSLALWVVPNVEIFHLDTPMPGDANERPKGGTPMVREWAQRDFGNRIGLDRVIRVLDRHNVRGTVALNSDVCVHMPEVVRACLAHGWELMGHGKTNTHRLNEVPPEEERVLVKEILDTIEGLSGTRPVGWLGSGLQETWNTLDYLLENGIRYVSDWVNDEQPYMMDVGGKSLVSVPYSYDLNDVPVLWKARKPGPEFERMIRDACDVMLADAQNGSGRVMCLALHPFVIGQPSVIGVLDRALEYILSHDEVWAATGSEICEAYLAQRTDDAAG